MWIDRTLGDHIGTLSGFAFSSDYFNDSGEGLPLIRIRDIDSAETVVHYSGPYPPAFVVSAGDILVGMDGEFNLKRWQGDRALLNQRVLKVFAKPGGDIDLGFAFYWLAPFLKKVEAATAATTVKHLSSKDVERAVVHSPDKDTQERIARILRALDTRIEATVGLIAKQDRMRAGLMQDLFTRGVDDHGQLRPPRAQAPHLYHQTELGWLPLGWEVSPLLKLVPRAVYGISDSLSDDANGLPILRMNNIQAGKIDASELKYSSKALPPGLLLRTGDVLFNRTNSMEHVGKSAIWNGEVEKASFASYLVRLDPDPARLDAQFLCHWLNRPEVQIEIRRYATPGVHQVNINPTNLRRVNCAHPSDTEEQRAIVKMIAGSDAVIDSNMAMVEMLRLQKSGLMQDLLTGKALVAPLLESQVESAAA